MTMPMTMSKSKSKPKSTPPYMTGYIEGYYGRLLSPEARLRILRRLAELGMTGYLYAPKEDPCHRHRWREAYDRAWLEDWRDLAGLAADNGISLIAGLAPGLDFDFAGDRDFVVLCDKLRTLTQNGALPCLLFDDIDPPLAETDGGAGEAIRQAELANRVADSLGKPLFLVPRIYADELSQSSPTYLPALAKQLDRHHRLFYCGSHIVAPSIALAQSLAAAAGIAAPRLIAWDNIYANDYCPRRLFLEAWRRPYDKSGGVMLNATGMVETDQLLLGLMAKGLDAKGKPGDWQNEMLAHGVPDAFFTIAAAFQHQANPTLPDKKWLRDLDELLWQWKSPLAREWYPYLLGLRGDVLMLLGEADAGRQAKIMPPVLYHLWQTRGGK